jgi:hypothetical protein
MPCIEFRLTMPGRNSWDGKWSGDGPAHTLARDVDEAQATKLDGRSWSYSWSDGWRAEVRARRLLEGESPTPSQGFRGYYWMIASILQHGKIYADHELPVAEAP